MQSQSSGSLIPKDSSREGQKLGYYLVGKGNLAAILLSSLGVVHILTGQNERGLEFFIEALKYNSNNPYIWNNLGVLALFVSDFDNAIKTFEHCTNVTSENFNKGNENLDKIAGLYDLNLKKNLGGDTMRLGRDDWTGDDDDVREVKVAAATSSKPKGKGASAYTSIDEIELDEEDSADSDTENTEQGDSGSNATAGMEGRGYEETKGIMISRRIPFLKHEKLGNKHKYEMNFFKHNLAIANQLMLFGTAHGSDPNLGLYFW